MGTFPNSYLVYFTPDGGTYYSESTEIVENYFNTILYLGEITEQKIREALEKHKGKSDVAVFVTAKKKDEVDKNLMEEIVEGLYKHKKNNGS